jgi:RNA polymerase sigma-70 factor (ECF subfamily)
MALAPDTRALIVLRHFQGLSYEDIAEIVGVPEKTVKSRLFSARQRLRKVLEERGWRP